jgi:predicted RNase H-like nuclease (RuvC/YqgF family)
MTLCDRHHAEVCYEGRDCPACCLADQRDKFEQEAKELERTVNKLEAKIENLESRIP